MHKGKPATGAVVFFHRAGRTDPSEPVPHGEANQEGRFSLTSEIQNDGAPAGSYTVTIVWPDPNAKPSKDGERPDLLKAAYNDAKNPKFKAEVEAKPNEIAAFELK